MNQTIVGALRSFKANPDCEQVTVVRPYEPVSPDSLSSCRNQFVVFLKPEALTLFPNVHVDRVLELFFSHFESQGITARGVAVLPAAYLRRFGIIEANYQILNRVSSKGLRAISRPVAKCLKQYLEGKVAQVQGGHECLEKVPSMNPLDLYLLVNQKKTVKLGAGVYAATLNWYGEELVLLNGFHPYQVETLTAPGTGIVAVECWTEMNFADVRNKVIGTIDPKTAPEKSLRRLFADESATLGFQDVSIQFNFVHVSPGLIEAAFQLKQFFSDFSRNETIPVLSTNMGFLLARMDGGSAIIDVLEQPPDLIPDGIHEKLAMLFHATEGLDTSSVLSHPFVVRVSDCFSRESV
jgi:nucleoside diphosphate kinase